MADNDDENLIGYDPLAWMHRATTNSLPDAVPEQPLASTLSPVWQETASDENTASAPVADNPGHISLAGIQNIQNVQALHEALISAFHAGTSIEIDASAVQTIDTASLQLLLIAKRSAVELQKTMTIDFPSERFIEATGLLDLDEMLEVDSAAAGLF